MLPGQARTGATGRAPYPLPERQVRVRLDGTAPPVRMASLVEPVTPVAVVSTLTQIRDRFGVKKVKEGDIYPEARRPGISDPDSERWIMLTHEQRLKRVVNALIDAGIHPGPSAVNVCCFRGPDNNLNGRDTKARTEVLLERGYVKGPNGRWKGAT